MNNHMIDAYLNESKKLDGSNYSNWKFKLQKVLKGQSVWAISNGDELKSTIAEGGIVATIQDWENRERKSKVLLKLSVKDCIIPHIRECKSTSDIS